MTKEQKRDLAKAKTIQKIFDLGFNYIRENLQNLHGKSKKFTSEIEKLGNEIKINF